MKKRSYFESLRILHLLICVMCVCCNGDDDDYDGEEEHIRRSERQHRECALYI